jgi:3-oxoacyl-[acyl-carrier protein] reductase
MGKLEGKVAIVTGASKGIGASIAQHLAEAGAAVAVNYASSKEAAERIVSEITAKGGRAIAVQGDVSRQSDVERLVAETVRAFGRLDILVNNAGVAVSGAVDDPSADVAGFARQYAINVGGVAAAVRAAAKIMGEGGRIISVGSALADRVPFGGMADYSATKAAVATYTKGWARDLGKKCITVNAVQPGPINTEMNPDQGDVAATLKAITALGRYGKAEEVAAAIVFLASPAAAYITGTTLDVDGGFAA